VALVFPKPILSTFTSDPEVLKEGIGYLRIVAFAYIPYSLMFMLSGILRGAGDTVPSMLISIITLWCVRIPLAMRFSKTMGSRGIWLGLAISPATRGRPQLPVFPVGTLEVPRLSDLGLPPVVSEFAALRNGLVLIAGATGSGKSSTLAAIVAEISGTHPYHVITLEDPVEFLHKHGKGIVNQREVGSDTPSFAEGVRAALREDPDVIVIGELRDRETAATALSAAETGHLVLATVHAPRATGAVNRLTDLFPSEYHRQVRAQVSEVLEGIVAQVLLPKASGPGRIAACEVLRATHDVRQLIRSGETHRLPSVIAQGTAGMITMEQSLQALCAAGAITEEVRNSRT
jgi:twitching motility protein PilT